MSRTRSRRENRKGLRSVDDPLVYSGRRLDGTLRDFREAVDLLLSLTVPQRYWEKVMAGRAAVGSPVDRHADVTRDDSVSHADVTGGAP